MPDPAACHARMASLVERPGDAPRDPFEARLRELTGFVTKVRHNPVRFRLPLTMRALAAAGVEIDFFTDVAERFGHRRRGGLDDAARVAFFVEALHDWLRPDEDDTHRLVADVLAHELTLAELAASEPVPPPIVDATARPGSRPRLRPGVRVLQLTVHPPDVAGTAAVDVALDRSRRCYAYVPTPAGPRVKRLDPALAPLLDLADGRRTVGLIAAALGPEVTGVYELLARRGLIDLEAPCT